MGWITCELCGDSAYDIIVPEHELVHEQERAREISLNYFDRPFDKYVENCISYVQAYPSNLVCCGGCGLVYRNPKPAEEFLLEIYRHEGYTEEFERIWKNSWKRIFDRQLRYIENISKNKGYLLDIGSQFGLLPELAAQHGWDAIGVDVSDHTAYNAAQQSLRIFHGELREADFPSNYFDVVTIMLVFENLPHFLLELKEINRILKHNGLIVIKIANVDYYLSIRKLGTFKPLKRYVEAGLNHLHLLGFPYQFGFGKQTINKALKMAGFRKVKIRNYYHIQTLNPWIKTGAQQEEKVVKAIANVMSALSNQVSFRTLNFSPWFEIYAYKS